MAPLKVATRVGRLDLPRQVLQRTADGQHLMPGNAVLPAHHGMLITRRLQEWVCLLSLDLPFATVQRLLEWLTGAAAVLSTSEARELVKVHGQAIQAAQAQEVAAWHGRPDREALTPQWVPATVPRRSSTWSQEADAAVEAALAATRGDGSLPPPPKEVAPQDWERVLAARQTEPALSVAALARLGPQLAPGQVVAGVDGVLVRRPQGHTFGEVRTARVATAAGYRYLCGQGDAFLEQLALLLRLCGPQVRLTLLADGGRWIREFYEDGLAWLSQRELILDWYHLTKKIRELVSQFSRGREASRALRKALLGWLWQGEVDRALAYLEEQRGRTRNERKLAELLTYLRLQREALPNYRQRRAQRQYNGSGEVEKANDLLVARRQKRRGMHWSAKTSEALASLKTLLLNQGWDRYWQGREVLPLVAP